MSFRPARSKRLYEEVVDQVMELIAAAACPPSETWRLRWASAGTCCGTLSERTVMPGFIDTHHYDEEVPL